MRNLLATFLEWYKDDFDEELPLKYEVCNRCQGKGKHVNPNVDGHGISPEEFAEDPDFKEAYFSGAYDVTCYECKGKRVVSEPDLDRWSDEAKAEWKSYCINDYEYERCCEMERRMGA